MVGRRVLAVVVLWTCAIAGCADGESSVPGAPEPDTTAGSPSSEIVIGVHGPKSGPAAALVEDVFVGFRAYVDQLNAAGGIADRPVTLIEVDDQFTVNGGTAAAQDLLRRDPTVVLNLAGADSALGAKTALEDRGVPYLTVALPVAELQDVESTFFLGTPLEMQAAALPSFLKERFDPAPGTLAVLAEEGQIYEDMVAHLEEAADEADLEIATVEWIDGQAPSFTTNLARLKSSGIETVAFVGALGMPGTLRDAAAIGFAPTWTGVGPWTTNFFVDLTQGALEGVEAVRTFSAVSDSGYDEYVEAVGSEATPSELGLTGWQTGQMVEAVLALAGDDLSHDAIVAALESTGDGSGLEVKGDLVLEYTDDRHWGSEDVLPARIEDGVWVTTGSWTRRFGS